MKSGGYGAAEFAGSGVKGGGMGASMAGPAIGAVGSLLGGGCGDDEPEPTPGATMLNKNQRLAIALMRAKMGQKYDSPTRPGLPQFAANPSPTFSLPGFQKPTMDPGVR